ncbi:MAG: hypothetical protein ACR2QL_08145 [Woeseiaceae bacterium]
MMLLLAVAILLSTATAEPTDRDACTAVKKQIRQIEARMRNGYSAAQGIRYEERLRKLKEKRYEVCR